MAIRLPDDSKRLYIIGRTGSGKTVAGVWHLSQRSWRIMPWVIIDYKGDELIGRLPTTEIKKGKKGYEIPKGPGLYVIRPVAGVDDDLVEDFLWKVKYHGKIGVYIDEGYMLPEKSRSPAFVALLTQGRSLKTPVIILSQRPVWLSRFVITESEFIQTYWLNDKRDRDTLKAVIPNGVDERLPEYHSWYYDVGKDKLDHIGPVPHPDEILKKFDPPKRTRLFAI